MPSHTRKERRKKSKTRSTLRKAEQGATKRAEANSITFGDRLQLSVGGSKSRISKTVIGPATVPSKATTRKQIAGKAAVRSSSLAASALFKKARKSN